MANPQRHFDDAAAQLRAGNLQQAMMHLEKLLKAVPRHADGWTMAGIIRGGQGDLDGAADCFAKAIRSAPQHAGARLNLAKVLFKLGRLDEVVSLCHETVRLLPELADTANILGAALTRMGRLDEAVSVYSDALGQQPDNAHLHHNLGNVLKMLGRPRQAADAFSRAVALGGEDALAPLMDQLRALCAWEELATVEPKVLDRADSGAAVVVPFPLLISSASAATQRRGATHYTRHNFGPIADHSPFTHRPPAGEKEKLTIGYLSADFHQHATAYLTAELFELHDRRRFEIIGYSYGPDDGSPMRKRMVSAFDRFVDIRAEGFAESARRIHRDGVDILVDLKGYTQHARTEIVALRPAPVQVNYLGYPGTMGAPFMDYFIGDGVVTPPEHQAHFSEQLVRLPGCYQCNDRQREIAESSLTRADCGLPERGFVFAGFNHLYKIGREVFGAWMALLSSVDGSVLWLLEGNGDAMANLRAAARAAGVDGDRIVFAPKLPLDEHLARIRLADLFLDTHPCNGHTTASDALWAGLPLLTLMGETFASRVAASLLTAVGLPELVTRTLDDYVSTGRALAMDADTLSACRKRLADARSHAPLFDSVRFTRHLEAAYRAMWARHLAGDAPAPIDIAPLP